MVTLSAPQNPKKLMLARAFPELFVYPVADSTERCEYSCSLSTARRIRTSDASEPNFSRAKPSHVDLGSSSGHSKLILRQN